MRTLTTLFLASLFAAARARAGIDVVAVGAYLGGSPTGGDPAPDGDGVFFGSGIPVINDAGEVVFVCTFTAGPGGSARETGIVRGTTAAGSRRLVVRQGDPAPDANGNFQRMDPTLALAVINNSGQVAFSARFVGTFGTNDTTGIVRGDVGPDHLTLLARSGETVDGVQLDGLDFSNRVPQLNASGQVVFSSIQTPAIILSSSGTNTVVARNGGAAPDASGPFISVTAEAPAINDLGLVAFVPEVNANGTLNVEFLRAQGSTLTQVVRDGDPAPDQNGTFDLFMTALLAPAPTLNASGEMALLAALAGVTGPATKGIFRAADPDHVAQIVRRGDLTPDANGSFLDFSLTGTATVAFNDAGQAAFLATLTGTSQGSIDNVGIFRGDGISPLIRVVRKGQAAPNADGSFAVLGQPAINAAGQVAFLATLTGTTKTQGIFLYDDVEGLIQVVRQGDPMLGSTIAGVNFAPDTSYGRKHLGINASGQVAFQFGLADGRGGIAVWSPGSTTTTTSTTTTVHTSSTTSTTSSSTSSTTSTTSGSASSTTSTTSVGPTSSTMSPTTSTPGISSTTTSLPPCITLRCIVDTATHSPSCADETLPPSVTKKLDRAIAQAELAPSQTAKKAKRLYKNAVNLLRKAGKLATKATHGRHPKLSPECAADLVNAIRAASALVVPPA